MTVPYFARLLILCLAAFFLLHLAFTCAAAAVSGRAIRRARRLPARSGERLLFGLRMLPGLAASAIAAGVCVPAYLWFEPETALERVGLGCVAAAALAASLSVGGITRAAMAAVRSSRHLRAREAARETRTPVLMLGGVFRPRLIVSRGARELLTPEQLAAAVRHEEAHGESRDNLKRLLILLAPHPLPGLRPMHGLERAWARMAEWAADDRAVAGDPRQAIALAEALVRVARVGAAHVAPALATHLLGDPGDLAARVERLIEPTPERVPPRVWPAAALAACGALAAFHPATLALAHEALEALAH